MTRPRAGADVSQAQTAGWVAGLAKWLVRGVVVASLTGVIIALRKYAILSQAWPFEIAVFALVTTAPQFVIDRVAQAAEAVADDDLDDRVIKRGFENLGAWVGMIERPLLLGALIGGFPEFLAGWYVLKG